MNASTEIRHLQIEKKMGLVSILELDDSWKQLMGIIPKNVVKDVYDCDIRLKKYRSEDMKLIENHSKKTGKLCADILFYEWGTSGRVRATLGHLKDLLVKAELYRAADYLAVDIMGIAPPARPEKGPAARVVFAPDEELDETQDIKKILDGMDYPSSAIENMIDTNCDNYNFNHSTFNKPVILKKVSSIVPDFDAMSLSFQTQIPPIVQNKREEEKSVSDLIIFSSLHSKDVSTSGNMPIISNVMETSDANRPNMTNLLNSDTDASRSNLNYPHLDLLGDSSVDSSSGTTQSSAASFESTSKNLTSSQLNRSPLESIPHNVKLSTTWVESSSNIPALSEFNQSSFSKASPNTLPVESTNIPELSLLINTSNSKNLRSCNSPLPNLSLNTLLPHFTYHQLEIATNNFDQTPVSQKGRFLGAGYFGQVFLADGLFSKPVAVKKLLLESETEVLIDDEVTKQFRNEVEVLSNYKHENLLSLLGYSCDGCTYCLLYEYIPGGALRDRLTKKHQLIWTERLYIAMGVAKALAYLHTAYSTPMIHRDVNTANILLDNNNKPKLSDFGLSTLAPKHTTNSGFLTVGTSAYMAPEAHRGVISILLDSFSFGVVLLELLTSLPPIDEARDEVDLVSYFEEHIEDDITPVLDVSVGDWISNGVNYAHLLFGIAQKCLYEKKRRPTMANVSQELIQLMRTDHS